MLPHFSILQVLWMENRLFKTCPGTSVLVWISTKQMNGSHFTRNIDIQKCIYQCDKLSWPDQESTQIWDPCTDWQSHWNFVQLCVFHYSCKDRLGKYQTGLHSQELRVVAGAKHVQSRVTNVLSSGHKYSWLSKLWVCPALLVVLRSHAVRLWITIQWTIDPLKSAPCASPRLVMKILSILGLGLWSSKRISWLLQP